MTHIREYKHIVFPSFSAAAHVVAMWTSDLLHAHTDAERNNNKAEPMENIGHYVMIAMTCATSRSMIWEQIIAMYECFCGIVMFTNQSATSRLTLSYLGFSCPCRTELMIADWLKFVNKYPHDRLAIGVIIIPWILKPTLGPASPMWKCLDESWRTQQCWDTFTK